MHEVLLQYGQQHPGSLQRAQIRTDVDNQSVVHAFNKGRAKDPRTHVLLVKLFNRQLEQGFWLSLKWVPTNENMTDRRCRVPSVEESHGSSKTPGVSMHTGNVPCIARGPTGFYGGGAIHTTGGHL